MTTIRATCPDCGDIDLAVDDVRIRVCVETDEAEYRFTCPSCEMVAVKSLEPRPLELLAAAGASISEWHMPAELTETHDGLVISHNDILDFHSLLASEDALAEALAALID